MKSSMLQNTRMSSNNSTAAHDKRVSIQKLYQNNGVSRNQAGELVTRSVTSISQRDYK